MTMLVREIIRENEIHIYQETIRMNILQLGLDVDINTVVFFDDISGTGKTIVDFLKKYKKELESKKVIINLLAITEEASSNIGGYLKSEQKLNVNIFAEKTYKKR